MSYKVKIVVAILNLMCLFATLVFPNDTTPFAILITIISVATWVFTTYADSKLGKIGQCVYVSAVSLSAAICFILGITTKVGKADSAGNLITDVTSKFDHYVLVVSEESFIYSGKTLPYTYFAVGSLAIVATFMLIEIFAAALQKKPKTTMVSGYNLNNGVKSISWQIDQEIGHIR